MINFDVFQTVGPRDFSIIKHTLKNNKKNINNYEKLYLFNEKKNFNYKDIENVDKSFFPFTLEYVAEKIENKERAGWVYAQLVKLYYPYLQTEKENVLVVDSDVFFTKKTSFFNKENKPIFTTSEEFHEPYFSHMLRLHPDLKRSNKKSGISHHMLFNKKILSSMIDMIESFHQNSFFDVYLDNIDKKERSPSADYEIYFHYVMKNFKNKYHIRTMEWKNTSKLSYLDFDQFEMISLPHYAGTRPKDLFKNIKERKFNRLLKCINNFIFLNTKNILNKLIK